MTATPEQLAALVRRLRDPLGALVIGGYNDEAADMLVSLAADRDAANADAARLAERMAWRFPQNDPALAAHRARLAGEPEPTR